MHKRTVIRIALLIVFVAAAASVVWYGVSAAENPHFGLAYEGVCQNITLVDGSGFEMRYLGMRPQAHAAAELELTQLNSDKIYTFGGASWEENRMRGVDAPYAEVYTDVGGERVLLHTDGYDDIVGSPPTARDYLLSFPRSVVTVSLPFPCYEGVFFVTLYLRECKVVGADSDGGIYSSVGDVIPLTFQVENPTATDKPFDVVNVAQGRTAAVVWLRLNDDSYGMPYLDSASCVVERRVGAGYEKIAPDEIREPGEYDYRLEGRRFYAIDITTRSELALGADMAAFPVMLPDEREPVGGEYRLTLEFAENEDGTGERYTLRLRLKFPEE